MQTSEHAKWALALVVALICGVAVEEVPKVGVPFTLLIVVALLAGWKGWTNA